MRNTALYVFHVLLVPCFRPILFFMHRFFVSLSLLSSLSFARVVIDRRRHTTHTYIRTHARTYALTGLFEHLFGREMPNGHTALGDVMGLEEVLSAPGISERWVGFSARVSPLSLVLSRHRYVSHVLGLRLVVLCVF